MSSKQTSISYCRGFTLIELVTVIILLGIVSLVVAPRFSGSDGYVEYAARDQIIAAARMAQQRSMYDHSANSCYRLSIDAARVGAQSWNGATYDYIGPVEWATGVAIDADVTVNVPAIYFDGLGNAYADTTLDNTNRCAGALNSTQVNISGPSSLAVCVYSTGYIKANAC